MGFVLAGSDVSVYQGQYFIGNEFQKGTFNFEFNVYDDRTRGNLIYSHSTNLTTGNWGEWYIELEGVASAAKNISKSYFMEIIIDGEIQGDRRRITQLNYLRKDVEEEMKTNLKMDSNITANYFIGDGSQLKNLKQKDFNVNSSLYWSGISDIKEINVSFINNDLGWINSNVSNLQNYMTSQELSKRFDSKLNTNEIINFSVFSNNTNIWAGVSGWITGWFFKSDGNLNFNESKLIDTINFLEMDTLGSINCSSNQIIKWNNGWVCAEDLNLDTNTQKSGIGPYLYNDSNSIYFNETELINIINEQSSPNIPVSFSSTVDGRLRTSVRYLPLGTDAFSSTGIYEATWIVGHDLVLTDLYWNSKRNNLKGSGRIVLMKSTGSKSSFIETSFSKDIQSLEKGSSTHGGIEFNKGDLIAIKYSPFSKAKGQIEDLSVTFGGHYT